MELVKKVKIWNLLDLVIDSVEEFEKLNKKMDGIQFNFAFNQDHSILIDHGIEKIAEALNEAPFESVWSGDYPYKYAVSYSNYTFYQISKQRLEFE